MHVPVEENSVLAVSKRNVYCFCACLLQEKERLLAEMQEKEEKLAREKEQRDALAMKIKVSVISACKFCLSLPLRLLSGVE